MDLRINTEPEGEYLKKKENILKKDERKINYHLKSKLETEPSYLDFEYGEEERNPEEKKLNKEKEISPFKN